LSNLILMWALVNSAAQAITKHSTIAKGTSPDCTHTAPKDEFYGCVCSKSSDACGFRTGNQSFEEQLFDDL
jgi:hypothetical protein